MYRMQHISATVYAISARGKRVGYVTRKEDGGFAGHIARHGQTVRREGSDPKAIFHELVKAANRVALCGQDDEAAARAAVAAQHAAVTQQVAEYNELMAGTGIQARVRRGRKFSI